MLMQGEQEHDHEHDQEHDHELDQEHDHEHDQEHDHEHDQEHEHKQEIYLRDKFFISVIGLFDFESVRHRNRLEFRHIYCIL
jgi:ABC-type Zn2+ transport system substrate-binding protein/surface adhesin